MVAGCEAALDSPQFQPEARERVQTFLKLYGTAAAVMEERRADVFVRRLIEAVGLRRQRLFAAQPEVAERLLGLSRLAELATAWTRREPHGSTRGFVAYLSAVAEAGVEPTGGEEPPAPGAVVGLTLDAVKGLGFDHVFALGLEAEAEWTRIGWPARTELVLSRLDGGEAGRPSRAYAEALAASPGGGRGGARGGALRPRRGPPRDLPDAARAGARGELAGGPRAVGAAPRHGDRRQPGDRPLPGAAEAGGARPAARRGGDGGGDRGGQRAAAPGRDAGAAGRARRLLARLLPARLRERAGSPPAADRRPRGALAGGLPAAPRRRPAQPLGLRPDPLPDLPAEVQVRPRLRHPAGTDDQPALRDPHAQRARTVPQGAARAGRGAADAEPALRGRLAARRLRRHRRRDAVPRPRPRGAAPLLGARTGLRVRAGLAGAQVRLQGRRPPRARAGRPGRPAARRRLRADRLQDRRTQDRGGPRLRPAAGALPDGGARGLGHRGRLRLLRLRARRREGGGADQARRRRAGRAHRGHGRRGRPLPGLRAAPLAERLQLVRLPPDLPGRPKACNRVRARACADASPAARLGSQAARPPRWRRKRWNSRAIESAEGSSSASSASRSTCSASIRSTSSSISGLAATARPICSS